MTRTRRLIQVRARQLLAEAVEHLGVGLQVGVADLAVQLDNLLQLGDRPAQVALGAVDHRDVIAGHRFPGPVPDLPPDRQRLPVVLQRPLRLTQAAVHGADIVQRGRFPGPVPDLPPDRQRLPVVLQRPLRLTQAVVHAPMLFSVAASPARFPTSRMTGSACP